jgi:sugar O-acyltransferase (sialic acid O-acetyltransferase NeuD family)
VGDLRDLIILGTGGYAQELLWIVDDLNAIRPTWNFLGFVDPAAPSKKGLLYYDRPILGGWDDAPDPRKGIYFACGLETPQVRKKECQEAERRGYKPATLVHPSVIIARHVEVGEGTVVGAGSILAPYARIGRHCAINLQVAIGHNSSLGNYCVVSPAAQILAAVTLEDEVFIGANATVYVGTRVGAGALLGANSFLLTNLAPGRSTIGVPASGFAQAAGAGMGTMQEPKSRTIPTKKNEE